MAYDNKTTTNKRTIKVNVKRHRCINLWYPSINLWYPSINCHINLCFNNTFANKRSK